MNRKNSKTKPKVQKSKMSVSIKKPTKSKASTITYFNEDEIGRLLSVLENGKNNALAKAVFKKNGQKHLRSAMQDRLMFMLGIELGTRVNELVGPKGLSWESFDQELHIVRVWDEKKDKYRNCLIPTSLWDELMQYRDWLSQNFDMRKEKQIFSMSDKTANRRIKSWALGAGIKRDVRWHMLRHTHVIQSRRVGRDWNWISMQTGDKASTLIEIYGKLTNEERQEISDQNPLFRSNNHPKGD